MIHSDRKRTVSFTFPGQSYQVASTYASCEEKQVTSELHGPWRSRYTREAPDVSGKKQPLELYQCSMYFNGVTYGSGGEAYPVLVTITNTDVGTIVTPYLSSTAGGVASPPRDAPKYKVVKRYVGSASTSKGPAVEKLPGSACRSWVRDPTTHNKYPSAHTNVRVVPS